MAGFFGLFNYNKPGKGVDVEAPPKKPFFRFWELYWRKFSRFILLNLLVFLFLLPIITLLVILTNIWVYSMLSESALNELLEAAVEAESGASLFGLLQTVLVSAADSIPTLLGTVLVLISAVFYGPVMCGMSYVLRNYWREEHAWISDFFVQMKKNFRQGAAFGLLELFALTMLFFNLTTEATEGTAPWLAASLPFVKYISVFLVILILFARQYAYAMMVTFDIKLVTIIKNSFAFAFLGLLRNFGVVFLEAVLIFAMIFFPIGFFDLIFLPLFYFSLTGFLTIFACFPLIHKHMLVPALERKRLAEEETENKEETAE